MKKLRSLLVGSWSISPPDTPVERRQKLICAAYETHESIKKLMTNIVLFCKSYAQDMLRAKRLAESVQRFNRDNIPFYFSVPERDLPAFSSYFGDLPCTFLTDEKILAESAESNGRLPKLFPPHLIQQLVKLEFWRLGLCENYAWIDSDSYFIREFRVTDFMFDHETPYLIQDEYDAKKELTRMAEAGVPKKVRERRVNDNLAMVLKFQAIFHTPGPLHLYSGTMPYIWSTKVLKSLTEKHLKDRGKTIHELLFEYPCETQLYGEYLQYSQAIPIRPRPNMFKCILYPEDFHVSQTRGESECSLAKEYFGLCIQSNWTSIRQKKSALDRLKRLFAEFLRAVGHFISGNKTL